MKKTGTAFFKFLLILIPIGVLVYSFFYYQSLSNSESRFYEIAIRPGDSVSLNKIMIVIDYYGEARILMDAENTAPDGEGHIEVVTSDLLKVPEDDGQEFTYGYQYSCGFDSLLLYNRQREHIGLKHGANEFEVKYNAAARNKNSAVVNNYYWFSLENVPVRTTTDLSGLESKTSYSYDVDEFVIRLDNFSNVDIRNIYPKPDYIEKQSIVYKSPEKISEIIQEGVGIFGYDFVRNDKNQSIVFFLGIIIGAMISIVFSLLIDGLTKKK